MSQRQDDRSDAALVECARAGDHEAFARLLRRHRTTAARVGRRLLGDADQVADVLQDAALTAYLNLGALRSPERFRGWFCGIVLNLCRGQLRRERRRPPSRPLDGCEPAGEMDAAPAFEEQELLREVLAATARLPDGQRQAALLVYVQGLSRSEAAAALGVSPGALKVRLHRAREALRAELLAQGEPAERKRRRTMVELEVFDIVLRKREDDEQAIRHAIVLLREKEGDRLLPIWVGEAEATSLAIAVQGFETSRPLTYHFAAGLLEAVDARVESVTVTKLVGETFYATVTLRSAKGGRAEVDARPSDAINLALSAKGGCPVFADEAVVAKAGHRVRVSEATRAGSAAIVEGVRQRVEALAKLPKEEAGQVAGALRELGLELLEEPA